MKIDQALRDRVKDIPTGNFADNNPHGGVIGHPIKALNPKLKMIGRAFTVKGAPGDNLAIYRGIGEAKENDVLVVDLEGCCKAGHFGDMMAQACKKKGLAGVIINGSTRDYQDILELEYPFYSLGYCSAPSVKEYIGETGVDITINGVTVHNGDLLFGDGDSIVVIVQGEEEKVIALAEKKHKKEIEISKRIDAGESILEIFGFDKVIEEKLK